MRSSTPLMMNPTATAVTIAHDINIRIIIEGSMSRTLEKICWII